MSVRPITVQGSAVTGRSGEAANAKISTESTGTLGDNGFSRFLTQMALYADVAALPPYLQQPGTIAYFQSAPHDKACVGRALDHMVAAMLEGAPAR